MTCYFPSSLGIGGPASVAGASARQGTSPFLADRDIRHRDARRAHRARAGPRGAPCGPPRVLGPVPRNAVLGSFHSHRGRSLGLPDPGDRPARAVHRLRDRRDRQVRLPGHLRPDAARIRVHPDPLGGHDAVRRGAGHGPVPRARATARVLAGRARGHARQPRGLLARVLGRLLGRPAADRSMGPIPVDTAPRGGPGPRVVRAARAGGRVLRPPPPGDPHLHQPAGRRGPDAVLALHRLHGPGLPALGDRAGLDRRPPRRAVGPCGGGHPPVRLGDRRGPGARARVVRGEPDPPDPARGGGEGPEPAAGRPGRAVSPGSSDGAASALDGSTPSGMAERVDES